MEHDLITVNLRMRNLLFPVTVAMDASSDGEEEVENADQMTETVMNGSMKETLSLTVDAKTETAVFKR